MRPFGVVAFKVSIEVNLHFVEALIPFLAALDAEVLVQQGLVQPFDEPVGLRAADFGRAVFDLFELEEDLVRVAVRPAAELAAIVGEDCVVSVPARREWVRRAHRRGLSLERGCRLFSVARSALDYKPVRPSQNAKLLAWLQRISMKYPDWGYRLAHGHIRECGWQVNRKRVHRLWKQAKLQQPTRPPRRKMVTGERLTPQARFRNHVWCYDFVHD